MDKLKPILVYKFWIICAVALLLPSVGYYMARGEYVPDIESRTKALDATFKKDPATGQPANDKWIQDLKKVTDKKAERFEQSAKYLWDVQQAQMVWPVVVRKQVAEVGYREPIGGDYLFLYGLDYDSEIKRIYKIADPYDSLTGKGTVQLEAGTLHRVPAGKWAQLPPTPAEMWDAQEDIWLQTSLLQAIRDVNKEAEAKTIADAPLRMVETLEFMGGSRRVGAQAAKPAATTKRRRGRANNKPSRKRRGRDDDEEEEEEGRDGFFGIKRNRGGATAYRGGRRGSGLVDFAPAIEFGNPTGAGGGSKTRRSMSRYVDFGGDLPFVTRGFYLKVVIDHRSVPDLISQLTNMPWPTQIFRVHEESRNIAIAGPGTAARRVRTGLGGEGSRDMLVSALADPFLSNVTICGTMTLYLPTASEVEYKQQTETAAAPAETTSAEGTGTEEADTVSSADQPAASPAETTETSAADEDADQSPPGAAASGTEAAESAAEETTSAPEGSETPPAATEPAAEENVAPDASGSAPAESE